MIPLAPLTTYGPPALLLLAALAAVVSGDTVVGWVLTVWAATMMAPML